MERTGQQEHEGMSWGQELGGLDLREELRSMGVLKGESRWRTRKSYKKWRCKESATGKKPREDKP